ncbi:hypothetical protein Ndes2526B_g07571 [Nannochloris sp. 'desiccata']
MMRTSCFPATLAFCLLAILACASAASTKYCIGLPSEPRLGVICAIQKNKNACLDRMALDNEDSTASCIWRQINSNFVTDIQNFSSRVGSMSMDVSYDPAVVEGGICGASFNTSLASGMKKKVGVIVQQLDGPNNKEEHSAFGPYLEVIASTCTAGGQNSTSRSCSTSIIPPSTLTYREDYKFNHTLSHSFFTTDTDLITQFNTTGKLNNANKIQYTVVTKAFPCKLGPLTPTPALSDIFTMGSTGYQLETPTPTAPTSGTTSSTNSTQPYHYSMQSYRTYLISNATGADWTVQIQRTLSNTGTENSELTVFLLKEAALTDWIAECKGICTPPAEMALNGTLCTGKECKGSVRGLGAKNSKYYLWVSFTKAWGPLFSGTYSNSGPLRSPYNAQQVSVVIDPKFWLFSS